MWRPFAVITLCFFLLLQINEIFALLRSDATHQFSSQNNVRQASTAKKRAEERKVKKFKNFQFYPVLHGALPNLRQGYLFNKERNLLKKGGETAPVNSVKIDDVFYAGSIIANNKKVALVFYEKQKQFTKKYVSPNRKGTKAAADNFIYEKLNIADSIGGYTVSQILPDSLILENDGSTLEKRLNDEDKPEIHPPIKTVRKTTKITPRNRPGFNGKKSTAGSLRKSHTFKRR